MANQTSPDLELIKYVNKLFLYYKALQTPNDVSKAKQVAILIKC